VCSIEVVDPDDVMTAVLQSCDSGRVAGLKAGVVGRCSVGSHGINARPALEECFVVDHHLETAARRRVVVQHL